jgi:anti-anti-sigma factor
VDEFAGPSTDEMAESLAVETSFAVRGTHAGDGWTFAVSGDLDLHTVPRLRLVMAEAFDGPDCDVVVDLAEVAFFEVMTLNLFAEVARRLERTGRCLFLRGLSPFQRRLLVTYGLTPLASGAWAEHPRITRDAT